MVIPEGKAAVLKNDVIFASKHAVFGTVKPHPLPAVRGTVITYLWRPLSVGVKIGMIPVAQQIDEHRRRRLRRDKENGKV